MTATVLSGSNGGTLLLDGALNCYQKIDYRGEPHEWGAYGDGSTDDTAALQHWLGAYGNYSTLAPASAPTNFGPWIATIPANYSVKGALSCPPYAVLQGFANDTTGISKTQGKGSPTVRIFAGASLSNPNGSALMTMGPYCRISGITLDANNQTNAVLGNPPIDAVDVAGTHAVIDGHALVEKGYYNVLCRSSGAPNIDGLQIKDAQIYQSANVGVYLNGGCQNIRLIGDIIQSSGAQGVYYSGTDLTLADGIIEQSKGIGMDIENADMAVVTGTVFADNSNAATSGQAPHVEINHAGDISMCANRFQGGGGAGATNSEVLLGGTLDNVTLCGNVYTATTGGSDANVYPSYIYDILSSLPTLTNVHFYETPEQPPVSVFASTAAQALLQPLQIPQFTNNQISGLTLANNSPTTPSQIITVSAGSAADSTNSTLITLSSPCSINLANPGPGGLDTGTAQPNKTYFIYIIAPVAGNASAAPSCMASTSSTTPTFQGTS